MRQRLLAVLVCATVVILGVPGISQAAPQDFTVNVTDDHDDGSCDRWTEETDCTLREAINASNASPGAGTISFDIHDATFGSVQTISPTSALPDITQPVIIDGYTEPGASENTLNLSDGDDAVLLIELDGETAGSASGLKLTGGGSTVRGLVINRFGINGITLTSDNNVVEGTFIGVDPSGSVGYGNVQSGVRLQGTPAAPHDNLIGGTATGARNVIYGGEATSAGGIRAFEGEHTTVQNNYVGVDASGTTSLLPGAFSGGVGINNGTVGGTDPGTGNVISGTEFMDVGVNVIIQGNLIGTNAAGTAGIGNQAAILTSGSNIIIGGPDPGAGNVISASEGQAVDVGIFSSGVTVQGNWIGTDRTGTLQLGNGFDGIVARGIGVAGVHDSVIEDNVVAFNGGAGIRIQDRSTRIAIRNNSVYSNGGLAIDLEPGGVTPNDPGDGDTGANGLQNFPDLSVAAQSLGGTDVQGTLNSTALTTFDVEIFSSPSCDPSGYGEGQSSLGTFQVTTNGSGDAAFDHQFAASTSLGDTLTATATAPDGSTSEFSACRTVVKAKTDLTLTKEDSPNIVEAGQNVTYTLTVSNTGPNAASGVGLSDPLPGTADLVSVSTSQGSCTSDSTVVCTLGTILKNGSATVTIVARLSTAGSVTNTATVDGTETDTDQGNNTASAITIVTPNRDGCTVVGTDGNDFLVGTSGNDTICGYGGNDTLVGKKGNDVLMGGDGDDVLKAGAGNDSAYGEDGNDTAVGAQGFDNVFGGTGADFLKIKDGAGGNDTADGGVDVDPDVCKKDTGDTVINCP